MRQLPVHFIGNCAFLQHNDDAFGISGGRAGVNVHHPLHADLRRPKVDPIFVHGDATRADIVDKRQQRRSEGQDFIEAPPHKHHAAHLEKALGSCVGVGNPALRADGEDGIGQGVQQLPCVNRKGFGFQVQRRHVRRPPLRGGR